MNTIPPAPPNHLPESPRFSKDSRYQQKRKVISWWGLLIGLLLGLGGGLFYAWQLAPIEEFNTQPYQLLEADKAHYLVAIMMSYAGDPNLNKTIDRLIELNLGDDPIGAVAEMSCKMAQQGYLDSDSGLTALRNMKTFYQLQGRTSCADTLIPDRVAPQIVELQAATPTPTLIPPPSKTPVPQLAVATVTRQVVPTSPPQREFEGSIAGTFCDVELAGFIEVFVQDASGQGLSGEMVRVRWDGGQSRFFTGLMPERGPSYADYQMEAGKGYTIDMPGFSDPISTPLNAEPCFTAANEESIKSYRVVFRQFR